MLVLTDEWNSYWPLAYLARQGPLVAFSDEKMADWLERYLPGLTFDRHDFLDYAGQTVLSAWRVADPGPPL